MTERDDFEQVSVALSSGTRKDYWDAVKMSLEEIYFGGDEKELILRLVEKAVLHQRMNKLIRKMRKEGVMWTNRQWVEMWFDEAARLSMETGSWLVDQGRLREWIRKGRLDNKILVMLELISAHPEQIEFAKMVEKRMVSLERDGSTPG